MKIRTKESSDAVSIRINKEEYELFVNKGNELFKERNIAYINLSQGSLLFSINSPFFKDFNELDNNNKEFSTDDEQKNELVKKAIEKKIKE